MHSLVVKMVVSVVKKIAGLVVLPFPARYAESNGMSPRPCERHNICVRYRLFDYITRTMPVSTVQLRSCPCLPSQRHTL